MLMKFSDIDDCGMCLMMKRGYCKGGVTLGSYGEPVYPPCAYSNAIVHAFQRFRAPFSGKIVHIFPEQSAAFN